MRRIGSKLKVVVLAVIMVAGTLGGFMRSVGALSVASVDSEQGPVEGGQEVTIYGDFTQNPIWKQISVGNAYVCAIASDDTVYCWGHNSFGQFGDGTTAGRNIPTPVSTANLPSPVHSVTFDIDGEPAECTDVKVASDGKSLTCTTTAHSAGVVDVTVNNGITEQTIVRGYEYIRNSDDGEDDDEDGGGLGILIGKVLSPETGQGAAKAMGFVVLGEIAFVVIGLAVFFKIREA